jgi:FtsP/CotA-like multicopper oxidase with cupredoxin domain
LQPATAAVSIAASVWGHAISSIALPPSRRGVLTGALAAAGFAAVGGGRGETGFAAPASAEPAAGDFRILRAQPSGFDGVIPGPTLRVRRGDELRIRLVNALSAPTAVHWHGVRLTNAMDGAAPLTQPPVAPAASFDYRFTPPDAGTFWYHVAAEPPQNARRDSISAKLYGALIVADVDPVDVDHDAALIFARPGNAWSVNGGAAIKIPAGVNERLRLRLLNADSERLLTLRLETLRAIVMATDGQPAQPFTAQDGRLTLGPGNRLDVFADCTLPVGAAATIFADDDAPIAAIACAPATAARALRPPPQPLPPNPLPQRMDFAGALRREAAIARPVSAPLFAVERGRTVVIGFSNNTLENGFIHLHGHSFRLLDNLDDGWKPFWLDTLPIARGSKARIAFVADNPGRWLIEGLSSDPAEPAWFAVA